MNNHQDHSVYENNLAVITTDTRLARILAGNDQACAVELWVLQLQAQGTVESRLLYGRASPFDFSNDRWSFPSEDHFKVVRDGLLAQCVRLTLYCSSNKLLGLLCGITGGSSIADASKNARISMSADFESRFGTLKLQLPLTVRPSMHLPTRDYFRWSTNKVSPLDSCSCDSASICSLVKSKLFLVGREEDRELASFAIDLLSADTGLEFANLDAWRLGDLELLVLPGLTERGGALVHLDKISCGTRVRVDQPLASGANSFKIYVQILNDGAVIYRTSKTISAPVTYPFTVDLAWPLTLDAIQDAFVLEIEAQNSQTDWLCFKLGAFLVREISSTIHVTGGQAIFESDWLSKALRPSHMNRLEEVQQITRHTNGTESVTGGRKTDPWVTANRHVTSMVKSLVPPISKGEFFLRYSEGENTGRLELAEWIKRLLADHRDKHIAWFDPYMEDMGVHLLNAYGSDSGAYTIFTGTGRSESTPWWERVYAWVKGGEPPKDRPDRRVRNMLEACKVWVKRYGTVRLRVFGLPQEDLHDRMILVRDAQMRPVAGYHLSNSLQKANENYPLLITPIPADVLQRVLDYSDGLLRSSASPAGGQSGRAVRLKNLFDSNAQGKETHRYIPIDIFGMDRVGEILDWWLSSCDPVGSSNALILKEQLDIRGLLCDGQLRGDVFEHLPAKIWREGLQLPDFNSAWDALGAILSSTMAGDTIYEAPDASVPPLRGALLKYLDSDRSDAVQPPEQRAMVDMTTELRRSLSDLMKQAVDPQQYFRHDVTEVSWGDYYALKVLWATDPAALLAWIEEGANERFKENRRRQLGLKCAMRLISFEIARSCSPRQLEALLKSTNGLLCWIGYVAFESIVHNDPKELAPTGCTSLLAPDARLNLLGWMTARAVRRNEPIKQVLIQKLLALMPAKPDKRALEHSVDSMRNVFGKVYDSPPWILREVLLPLVNTQRIEIDVVARLWFDELFKAWTERDTSSIIFRIDTEGYFTDEVASLCAATSVSVRKTILKKVSKEIRTHTRVVQRPFSAQINWSSYDQAFQMLLWISSYLSAWLKKSSRPSEIEQVLQAAEAALARRSEGEWARSYSTELLFYQQNCNQAIR